LGISRDEWKLEAGEAAGDEGRGTSSEYRGASNEIGWMRQLTFTTNA